MGCGGSKATKKEDLPAVLGTNAIGGAGPAEGYVPTRKGSAVCADVLDAQMGVREKKAHVPRESVKKMQNYAELMCQQILDEDIVPLLNTAAGLPEDAEEACFMIGTETDPDAEETFKDKPVIEYGKAEQFDKATTGRYCGKGLKKCQNQDSFFIARTPDFSVYCVLDGHGLDGHLISEYAKEVLLRILIKDPELHQEDKREALLIKCFRQTQAMIEKASEEGLFCAELAGATVSLVLHDHPRNSLLIANVGDSSIALCKKKPDGTYSGEFVTVDHTPEIKEEADYIAENGALFLKDANGKFRIFAKGRKHNGVFFPGMNMSRALGDCLGHEFCGIRAIPTVREVKLEDDHHLLLLCSDGVWEFLDVQQACDAVLAEENFQVGAEKLAKLSYDQWMEKEKGAVSDDITVVAIKLEKKLQTTL